MNTTDIQFLYSATVGELFNLPIFKGSRLIAGEKSLSRPVVGFNLSDTPEYDKWLSEHEILITTCYSICQNPDALAKLVPTAAAKGISGLFIKPAKYLGSIPSYMAEQAETYGIPLIELPADIRFSAITAAISEELIKRQTALLQKTISVNQMLTEIITNGAGLNEICHMISELTGSSVMILDTINNRRAMYIPSQNKAAFPCENTEEIAQFLTSHSRIHELSSGGGSFGYLFLYGSDRSTYLAPELLTQILHTIPLEISRWQGISAARNADLSNYIFHLLSDPITDFEWENSRAVEAGLDTSEAYLLLRLQLKESPGAESYAGAFQKTMALNHIHSAFHNLGFTVRLIRSGAEYIFLFSTPQDNSNLSNLPGRFSYLANALKKQYKALRIVAGSGRPHTGLTGIIQSSQEAVIALKAAANSSRSILCFDELGVLRLIYAENPEKEIENYITETLGELVTSDNTRNADLLNTLECYLNNLGNIRKVSEEMFTHYNTVSYRLKNLSEITGCDLHSPEDRFKLELALNLFHAVRLHV